MAECSSCRPKQILQRGRRFNEIHQHLVKYKDIVSKVLRNLESDAYIWFCFVKLIQCNGAYACNFSSAWCVTKRNLSESDENRRRIVYFADVFNIDLVKTFMEKPDLAEGITDAQLKAFEKLASFLEKIEETAETVYQARCKGKDIKESSWAALLGVHILKRLAVEQQITFDTSYSDKIRRCPCGSPECEELLKFDDNSMGHKDVWHGNMDIIMGQIAVVTIGNTCAPNMNSENMDFEVKSGELEDSRSQLIAETITFAYLLGIGLVPVVGISKRSVKVFMYDPKYDLLYESSEMSLFDSNDKLVPTSVISLWLLINHVVFCTGVKSSHEDLGYTADFKTFVKESVYEKKLQMGGCKHVKRAVEKIIASENMGLYKRLKCD